MPASGSTSAALHLERAPALTPALTRLLPLPGTCPSPHSPARLKPLIHPPRQYPPPLPPHPLTHPLPPRPPLARGMPRARARPRRLGAAARPPNSPDSAAGQRNMRPTAALRPARHPKRVRARRAASRYHSNPTICPQIETQTKRARPRRRPASAREPRSGPAGRADAGAACTSESTKSSVSRARALRRGEESRSRPEGFWL